MKTKSAQLMFAQHFKDSLVWLLPVSLIVFTFLILFFSISEQVSNIKSVNAYLLSQNERLQDKVAFIEATSGFSSTPVSDLKSATSIKDHELIKHTLIDYQQISVNNKMYWSYALEGKFPEVKPDSSQTYLLEAGNIRSKVVSYIVNDKTKSPAVFDLHEYNPVNKTLVVDGKNYSSFVLFVNGKVVIYNDLANNDKATLKSVLDALAKDTNSPANIKQSASEELKKL